MIRRGFVGIELAVMIVMVMGLIAGTQQVSNLAQKFLVKNRAAGQVTCSSNCKSGSSGEYNFCYNECVPGKTGYSRPIGCNSSGFVKGNDQVDAACGSAPGTVTPPGPTPTAAPIPGDGPYGKDWGEASAYVVV